MSDMTPEEHMEHHKKLHDALDILTADYIRHGKLGTRLPSKTSVMQLMSWSNKQTTKAVPPGEEVK